MANYSTLISQINAYVKQNGNKLITGQGLQTILDAMVVSLGNGFQFIGVATIETEPGTPDQKVAYFAGPGTYSNFGEVTIPDGYAGFLYGSGSTWNVATAKTSPFTAETVVNDIIQLMDGTTPVYPRTRAEAVFFGNDQTDTLDEKVEEIEGNISLLGQECAINDSNIQSFINYKNSPLFEGWIDGTSFILGNYYHKIIPVNGGQIITIKAGENSTKIAIVKSYTPPTQNNNFIDYATGESERVISVLDAKSTIVSCPSDAKYIIIGDRYVNSNNTPSILEIDGHNLFNSILVDIQESKETASKTKSELQHEEEVIGKIGEYETNPNYTNAALFLGWKCPYNAFLNTIKINANSTSESIYIVKLNEYSIVTSSKRYIINNLIVGSERTYDVSDMNILVEKGDFVVMQHLNYSATSTTNKGDIQFSVAPNISVQGSEPGNRSFCFEAEIIMTIGGFIDSLISKENEELTNKTYLVIGDSISDPSLTSQATKRYFDWLREIDNITIINDGKSGTGYVRAFGSYPNIPTRIENYTFNAPDYISIFAGTNDWYGNSGEGACDLGQYGDGASSGTFYGALEDTFTKLINKYPSSKILIALPIHRWVEINPNARGNTLLQFVNAIREVAFKYSFTVIDLYNEGGVNPLFESLKNEYFGEGEGTHPNNKGHKRLYPKFKQGLLRT